MIYTELITDFILTNFPTLMILLTAAVLMIVNRKEKIPAAQLFTVLIIMVLALCIGDTVSKLAELAGNTPFLIQVHLISEVIRYILRPLVILIQLMIIIKPEKLKIVYYIPAVINGAIFSTALFGGKLAFFIDENNHWHRGRDWQYSIYVVQIIYILLLLVHSIKFSGRAI